MAKDKDGNWIPDWPMCDKCNYRHLEKVTCEENAERKRQQRAKGKGRKPTPRNPNLAKPGTLPTTGPDLSQTADGGSATTVACCKHGTPANLLCPDCAVAGTPQEEALRLAEEARIAAQAKRDREAWVKITNNNANAKSKTTIEALMAEDERVEKAEAERKAKADKGNVTELSGRLRCTCTTWRNATMCEHVEEHIQHVLDNSFDCDSDGVAIVPLFEAPVYVPSVGNVVPEVHVHVGPEDDNQVRMVRLVPSDKPWAEGAFPVIGMITQVDGRRAVRNMVKDKLLAIQAAEDGPITCNSDVHDPNLVFPAGLAAELYDTYCRAYNQTCLRCTLVTTAIGVDA